MSYTLEEKRSAYGKLPPNIQELITSTDITDFIAQKLKDVGLNDAQANFADSEILYAMYGLQSMEATIQNISDFTNKKVDEFSSLRRDLQDEIFDKYPIQLISNKKEVLNSLKSQQTKEEIVEKLIQRRVGGPESITPPNLPMVEEGEVAHTVPHVESKPTTPTISVASSKFIPPQRNRYPGGKDPYREIL